MAGAPTRTEYPIPAKWNLVIIACQLLGMFGIFYGAAFATMWWQLLLLATAFAIVGNSAYSVIHEAEHRMLHPNARVNDFLGVVMALFFPAPYHLLRQGHLAHHRFNRSDKEVFDLYHAEDRPVVKWLKLYGIITGIYWGMVVLANFIVLFFPFTIKRQYYEFDNHMADFVDALNPKYWGYIKLEAALAIGLHVLIVYGMNIPWLNYALVYFGFGFSWSAMQYVHHFGTKRHVLDGARNLWFWAPIDAIWLHHNWHLAHHQHPTVPWIYLPNLGRKESPKRDWLPWHYLKMWKGPRYTEERVENAYTGRISQ
ncbi:MAG: fatty acid desaturase [Planctomycetaceae bacterium]|nr:fatty acid desaturase [Planctomycetaceae bacterium]